MRGHGRAVPRPGRGRRRAGGRGRQRVEPGRASPSCATGCPTASSSWSCPATAASGPAPTPASGTCSPTPQPGDVGVGRAGPARRRAGARLPGPDARRPSGSVPAPAWPAPTSATAPRRSSTRTSAGSWRPPRVDEGWEPAGHPHGTLMLARRPVLEEVGLFDERYFAYCEEADLALRAAKAAGWETGLIRGAIVVNPDLGTRVAVIDYLQLRNTLLLVREHSGRYHATIRCLLAVGQLLAGLASPARRGPVLGPAGPGAGARRPRSRPLRRRPRSRSRTAERRSAQIWPSSAAATSWRTLVRYQAHSTMPADHGEGAEHDRGHPHDLAAFGQGPGPLRPAGGVEQRPDAEGRAGWRPAVASTSATARSDRSRARFYRPVGPLRSRPMPRLTPAQPLDRGPGGRRHRGRQRHGAGHRPPPRRRGRGRGGARPHARRRRPRSPTTSWATAAGRSPIDVDLADAAATDAADRGGA